MLRELLLTVTEPRLRSLEEILGIHKIEVEYITGNTYIPVRKTCKCPVCGTPERSQADWCDPRPEDECND